MPSSSTARADFKLTFSIVHFDFAGVRPVGQLAASARFLCSRPPGPKGAVGRGGSGTGLRTPNVTKKTTSHRSLLAPGRACDRGYRFEPKRSEGISSPEDAQRTGSWREAWDRIGRSRTTRAPRGAPTIAESRS
jgi:hypothetical protein